MGDSIWQAIAITPWWFYLILYYILTLCIRASKPHIASFRYIVLIPGFFICLLLVSLPIIVSFTLQNFLIWLGTALFGILLGWLQFRLRKVKAIKNETKFYLPGSWSLLVLIILVIIAKYYYFGYQILIDPHILKQPKFAPFLLAAGGILTGLFIGRLIYLLRCLKFGPYLS